MPKWIGKAVDVMKFIGREKTKVMNPTLYNVQEAIRDPHGYASASAKASKGASDVNSKLVQLGLPDLVGPGLRLKAKGWSMIDNYLNKNKNPTPEEMANIIKDAKKLYDTK